MRKRGIYNLIICKACIYSLVGAASLTGHAASAVEGRKADAIPPQVEILEADAVATAVEGLEADSVATAMEGLEADAVASAAEECEVVCATSFVDDHDSDFDEGI